MCKQCGGPRLGDGGQGQPELTVEEAGLGFGVAFGVAIPSPAQLLSVEEVPEPGAGVQAVPGGRMVGVSPDPQPPTARLLSHPESRRFHQHVLLA